MNREILFRGKRVDNGEWIDGYLFDDGYPKPRHVFVGGLVINEYKGTACDEWDINAIDFADVKPDTICQYTGLTDKNGKKIWENDIVQVGWYKGTVEYEDGCFVINWYNVKFLRKDLGYWADLDCFYTVGNIFDNPELVVEILKQLKKEHEKKEIETEIVDLIRIMKEEGDSETCIYVYKIDTEEENVDEKMDELVKQHYEENGGKIYAKFERICRVKS